MARDERGRYHSLKTVEESVPSWASGCDKCTNGIVAAQELTGVAPLYLERMAQALDKDIEFCTCRAGKAYHASLLNRHQKLIEEARKDSRMERSAMRNTHPDIEAARRDVKAAYAVLYPPPTVHAEMEPA